MTNAPTYHVGEVLELINMIDDLSTIYTLGEVIIEERYRYTVIDLHNIEKAWTKKVDDIKRRTLNQGK